MKGRLVKELLWKSTRERSEVAAAEKPPSAGDPNQRQLGEDYLRKRNQILDLEFKREAMNLALDQPVGRETFR